MLLLAGLGSCSCEPEEYSTDKVYKVRSSVLPVNTMPQGYAGMVEFKGSFNPYTHSFIYNISWRNLSSSPTGGGIFFSHPTQGNTHTIRWDFSGMQAASGIWHSSVFLDETQVTQLLAGQLFFIVTTGGYPAGEISGHLTATL